MKNQKFKVLAVLFFGTIVAISFFACHNAGKYRGNSIWKKEELKNNLIKTYLEQTSIWNESFFCLDNFFKGKESLFLCEKNKLKKPRFKKSLVTVVATAYYKPSKGEKNYHAKIRMNGDGKRTAFGTIPKIGTIAADPRIFPKGTILFVPGYGIGTVEDKGSGIKNYEIDVFMGAGKKAYEESMEWGRQKIQIKIIWLAKK